MAHGNKKYFFEELKKRGDTIIVKSANIYSLTNQIKSYKKINDPALEYKIEPSGDGEFIILRTSHKSNQVGDLTHNA